jgi:hypothetical protein
MKKKKQKKKKEGIGYPTEIFTAHTFFQLGWLE